MWKSVILLLFAYNVVFATNPEPYNVWRRSKDTVSNAMSQIGDVIKKHPMIATFGTAAAASFGLHQCHTKQCEKMKEWIGKKRTFAKEYISKALQETYAKCPENVQKLCVRGLKLKNDMIEKVGDAMNDLCSQGQGIETGCARTPGPFNN
jgi:hypothetical protein